MKTFIGMILLSALLIPNALATSKNEKNLHITTDPFTGAKTMILLNINTEKCKDDQYPDQDIVSLSFGSSGGKEVSYYLSLWILSNDPPIVPAKSKLNILIDGVHEELFALAPGSIVVNHALGPRFHETVTFQVTREELEKIAQSKEYEFRLEGSRYIQHCSTAKDFASSQIFFDHLSEYKNP